MDLDWHEQFLFQKNEVYFFWKGLYVVQANKQTRACMENSLCRRLIWKEEKKCRVDGKIFYKCQEDSDWKKTTLYLILFVLFKCYVGWDASWSLSLVKNSPFSRLYYVCFLHTTLERRVWRFVAHHITSGWLLFTLPFYHLLLPLH